MNKKTIEDLRNTLIMFKSDIDNMFDEKINFYSNTIYKYIQLKKSPSIFDILINKSAIKQNMYNQKKELEKTIKKLEYIKKHKNKINNILLNIIKKSNNTIIIDSDKSYTNLLLFLRTLKKYIDKNDFKTFENKIITVTQYILSLEIKVNNVFIKKSQKKIIDIYPEIEELIYFLNDGDMEKPNNYIPLLLPFDFLNKKYSTIMNFDDIFYIEKNVTEIFNKERYVSNAFLDIKNTSFDTYEKLKSVIPLVFYDKKNEDFKNIYGFSKEYLIQDKYFLNKNLHSNIKQTLIINQNEKLKTKTLINSYKTKIGKGLLWNNITKSLSFKKGYRCSFCGSLVYDNNKIKNPDSHEVWETNIDDDNKIIQKKLKNIISLCKCCHSSLHCFNFTNSYIDNYNKKNDDYIFTLLGYILLNNIPSKENAFNEGMLQKRLHIERNKENDEKLFLLQLDGNIIKDFDMIENIFEQKDIHYEIKNTIRKNGLINIPNSFTK